MYLNKTDTRKFLHAAEGYGIEVYGGTPEQRRAAFEIQFDEPTVFVDARDAADADDLFKNAIQNLSDDEETIREGRIFTGRDLGRALEATSSNVVIVEFDGLPSEERTVVAQRMKGLAEGLRSDEIKIGFTSETGGEVVHAEPDLRMRVKSREVDPDALYPELADDGDPDTDGSDEGDGSGGNHVGPIVFSDPDARRQLEQHGEVVTFRTSKRTTGETWWRKSRTGRKMGNCRVELIGPVDTSDRSTIREYHRDAGFRSVYEWEDAIEEFHGELPEGYLYRVTSDERWTECESCHTYSPEVVTAGRGPNATNLCPDCRELPGSSPSGEGGNDAE